MEPNEPSVAEKMLIVVGCNVGEEEDSSEWTELAIRVCLVLDWILDIVLFVKR
jgi:hypothetical protein